MKRWGLLIIGLAVGAITIFRAHSRFDFQSAQLFLKAHENAFDKMRVRTQNMKQRIDKCVKTCKWRIIPSAVKNCVACKLKEEMTKELHSLKSDLHQLTNSETTQSQEHDNPMTHLMHAVIESIEAELEKHDMLPIVEAAAKKKL